MSFAFGAFLLAVGLTQDPASARTVFRAESRVVFVDVLVERDGRAIPGLGVEDFEVLDEGRPQPLVVVSRDEAPLELVLALDASSSMAGAKLDHLRDATRAVIEALSPDDAAALLSFSHHVTLQQPRTNDRVALLSALESLRGYGETAWRDALFTALALTGEGGRREIVMLFTDGDDTFSWLSDDAVVSLARESNALVYAVTSAAPNALPDTRSGRDRERARPLLERHARRVRMLREVAEATGGKLLELDADDGLRTAFMDILRESGARYLLAFSPESPIRPGWHELEVKVKNLGRGVDVHARRGYYFETR